MSVWAAKWVSENRLDGKSSCIMYEGGLPKLFRTRKQARAWIKEKYGYIASRSDLRDEPYGWRVPNAIRVKVTQI